MKEGSSVRANLQEAAFLRGQHAVVDEGEEVLGYGDVDRGETSAWPVASRAQRPLRGPAGGAGRLVGCMVAATGGVAGGAG